MSSRFRPCSSKPNVPTEGNSNSMQYLQVTQQLLAWTFPHFSNLKAVHVPYLWNNAADFLPCQTPPLGEWRLHPDVVNMIWARYGKAAVDLFASEATIPFLWTSPLRRTLCFSPIFLILATLDQDHWVKHRLLLEAPHWSGRLSVAETQSSVSGERTGMAPKSLPPLLMGVAPWTRALVWHLSYY